MPAWVIDINENILLPEATGYKRHWTKEPPWPDPDYEDPGKTNIHHMYRINLNENTLMNLFRDQTDSRNPIRLTFAEYYEKPIVEVIDFFTANIPQMPKDDLDTRNRRAFSNKQWDQAGRILLEARQILIDDGRPELPMKDLYLDTFHQPDRVGTLTKVWRKFKNFQQHLRWICVPFLRFPVKADPNNPRPTASDLNLHLNGGIAVDPTGTSRELMPFGGFDYKDMLFYCHQSQEEACAHRYARVFAHCKGFFDKERVTDRVRRERDNRPAPAPPQNACFDPDWDCMTNPYPMMGGGNGYICSMATGTKKCIVHDPIDYCVNNGSRFCP